MNIKQLTLVSFMVAGGYLYSSNAITTYTTATTNLLQAQNALSTLMNGSTTNYSNQGVGTVQTTIANNSAAPVSVLVFNSSNTQINNISLAARSCTYAPINATSIQLVDAKNKTLTPVTSVKTNTSYSISYINNKWEITELATTTNYSHTNSTNIPLIIKITVNNIELQENINPSESFAQTINNSSSIARKLFLQYGSIGQKYSPLISVQVHANLSGIIIGCNEKASYEINIVNGQLACTQTSTTGSMITNKTGWPMLINSIFRYENVEQTILDNTDRYQLNNSIDQIAITPLIENQSVQYIPAKSISVTNTKGVLTF